MIIRAFLVVMILLLSFECNAYTQDKQDKVVGGYKECVVYKTNYKLGKLDIESRYKELHCYYDSEGKKIIEIAYRPNGVFEVKETSVYNSKGRIDTIKGYSRIDTTDFDYFKCFTYNEYGDLIHSTKVGFDTRLVNEESVYKKASYKYNKKGDLIQKIAYYVDGKIDMKCEYKYDSKGNRIKEVITNANRAVFSNISFKYDKKKNIIERITYIENGQKINQKFKYKYDVLGNETEEIIYKNLKEPIEKREYIYTK